MNTLYNIYKEKIYSDKNIIGQIISHIYKISNEEIYISKKQISQKEINHINNIYNIITQKDYPIEYIFGYKSFLGNEFFVNKNTLIPRLETERIVNQTLLDISSIRAKSNHKYNIYDIGTGSGVIGLSLGIQISDKYRDTTNKFDIYMSDISQNALKITHKNYSKLKHKINAKITNIYISTKNLLKGYKFGGVKTAFVLANLPYVTNEDYYKNQKQLKREPKIALTATHKGMKLYYDLIKQIINIQKKTKTKFYIYLEVNKFQFYIIKNKFPNFRRINFDTGHPNIYIIKGIL